MSTKRSAPALERGARESARRHRRALGVPDLVVFIAAASAPLPKAEEAARAEL
jgi:hypothetical protein